MLGSLPLFFEKKPQALPLYIALEQALLQAHPDTRVQAAKTQISFFSRSMYACASLPRGCMPDFPGAVLLLTLCLPAPLDTPRLYQRVEAAPGRWTHHFPLRQGEEIDGELLGWVQEAWLFAQHRRGRTAP